MSSVATVPARARAGPAAGGAGPVRTVPAREGHAEALPQLRAGGTDVLVAFNDELAVRMLRALRRRGVAVPEQGRVPGVDGLALSPLVTPALTTLARDLAAIESKGWRIADLRAFDLFPHTHHVESVAVLEPVAS